MLAWPWSGNSAAVTEVIGTGDWRLGRRMRLPVTVIAASLPASGTWPV
ncbi:MAG TPA: hypothetical protein VH331_02835 [Allosphingosinicella sp.]|nr:hypothetical protein [Allosphingosinicella sp.]